MKIQGEEYHGTYYDHWRFDGVFLSPANECKVVELDLYNSYDYYLVTIIGITKQISKKKNRTVCRLCVPPNFRPFFGISRAVATLTYCGWLRNPAPVVYNEIIRV